MSPASAASSPRIRTVTELTLELQGVVAERFDDVLVRGEITNLRRVASGHVYLSLKDAGAILPAVVWRSLATRLRFRPEDGLEVVCRGNLDVYPPHGKYQLIVQQMEPLGLGALQLAFEQLKKRLEAEGLFAPERKVAAALPPEAHRPRHEQVRRGRARPRHRHPPPLPSRRAAARGGQGAGARRRRGDRRGAPRSPTGTRRPT